MTFSSFLLASTLSVGAFPPVTQTNHATPAPAPASAPAPLVSATPPAGAAPVAAAPGAGCCGKTTTVIAPSQGCGCEPSCRPGLLESLRGLFSRKSGGDCGCAPAPAPAPVIIHHAPKADPCAPACDPCANARPSFFDFFRRNRKATPDCGCGSTVISPAPAYHGTPSPAPAAAPAPAPAPAKLPAVAPEKTGSLTVPPTITPAAAKSETGPKLPFDSARRHGLRGEHAADFSTITGQLTFAHVDGGVWVLRYADLGTEDANGGSVILARDARLSKYREGDVIRVEGRIVDSKGSSRLGGPLYQVRVINLIDRPTR